MSPSTAGGAGKPPSVAELPGDRAVVADARGASRRGCRTAPSRSRVHRHAARLARLPLERLRRHERALPGDPVELPRARAGGRSSCPAGRRARARAASASADHLLAAELPEPLRGLGREGRRPCAAPGTRRAPAAPRRSCRRRRARGRARGPRDRRTPGASFAIRANASAAAARSPLPLGDEREPLERAEAERVVRGARPRGTARTAAFAASHSRSAKVRVALRERRERAAPAAVLARAAGPRSRHDRALARLLGREERARAAGQRHRRDRGRRPSEQLPTPPRPPPSRGSTGATRRRRRGPRAATAAPPAMTALPLPGGDPARRLRRPRPGTCPAPSCPCG